MLSRALSLATVTLLIGCLTAGVARAVENLDAGKSPSQIFSGTCSACHKSPRGLLKSVPASSLPGFLRQHYTTGTDMASVLSSYLISNGAADPRYQGKDQPERQPGKTPSRTEGRISPTGSAAGSRRPHLRRRLPGRMPTAATPQGEGTRPGRDAKRLRRHARRPTPKPADGQAPVQAATDSKSGARQKQGRRGKPVAGRAAENRQATPRRYREGRSGAGCRQSRNRQDRILPGRSPPRLKPARSIPPDRRAQGPGRRAGQRGSEARRRRSAPRADPRPPRSMLPRRMPAASRRRSGPIRCRRSRRRRQLPQRPRLSRPRALCRQRRLHR